jgi:hypothetical protein
MRLRLRVNGKTFVCASLAVAAACTGGCRKILGGGSEQTSMGDVEANLDQLINVTKSGLNLQVSPRFLTLGPLPSNTPWEKPVPASPAIEVQGQRIAFKTGKDGLVRERYEARACPLREIWSCVELWATGRFGKDGELGCVGLRLENGDTIEKRKLDLRAADNCPFMTSAPGPAQQVIRGLEKAQLEHTERQEVEQFLDPKAR